MLTTFRAASIVLLKMERLAPIWMEASRRIREGRCCATGLFDDREFKRLMNASDPDFRKLVQAALLTGCRYGELSRLTAEDFNPPQ